MFVISFSAKGFQRRACGDEPFDPSRVRNGLAGAPEVSVSSSEQGLEWKARKSGAISVEGVAIVRYTYPRARPFFA